MSASRRSRSSTAFDTTSSTASPACAARNPASTGGSRSIATTSLALIRTVPATSARPAEAARRSAAPAAAIASACGRIASAASVGDSPRWLRTKRRRPSAASSSSRWRATVGCVRPRARAAPESEPSSSTERSVR